MSRTRATLAISLFLLFTALLAPRIAGATNFTQMWSLAGWNLRSSLGNLDSDPQPELMFSSKVNNHFAIVDGRTGVIEREFPQFAYTTTGYETKDLDGDGKPELLFTRSAGGSPLNTAYHWNGSAYVTVFSNTDAVQTWGPTHLRSATANDIFENLPNDIIIRDLSGNLLFRASTAIPGWVGSNAFAQLVDLNGDGVLEMLVMDIPDKAWMFKYNGAFTQIWSRPGWFMTAEMNLDSDPQPEFIAYNTTSYQYGLIDGLTGTVQNEFPAYTVLNISSVIPSDLDGDGLPELVLLRPYSVTQNTLCQALKWNVSKFDTLFKSTDPTTQTGAAHLRSTGQTELLETIDEPDHHDIRIRDTAGHLLFTGSTNIPGWSNSSQTLFLESILDGNGTMQHLVLDGTTTRAIHYNGSFVQTWAASGWRFSNDVGNTDSTPGHELMMTTTGDGHHGLFDVATGTEKKDFPDFTYPAGVYQAGDADGDGRNELYFYRTGNVGQPSLARTYKWNGSTYATVFTHTDSIQGVSLDHLRAPSLTEVLEVTFEDLRLRDPLTGLRLFTASSDLPGFTSLDMSASNIVSEYDLDGNGTSELLISDLNAVRAIRYAGFTGVPKPAEHLAFQVLPSAPSPFRASTAIRFALPNDALVGVRIYDAAGRLVRSIHRNFPAGRQELAWDGRDDAGHDAPNGVLFLSITANGSTQTGKLVRMR